MCLQAGACSGADGEADGEAAAEAGAATMAEAAPLLLPALLPLQVRAFQHLACFPSYLRVFFLPCCLGVEDLTRATADAMTRHACLQIALTGNCGISSCSLQ